MPEKWTISTLSLHLQCLVGKTSLRVWKHDGEWYASVLQWLPVLGERQLTFGAASKQEVLNEVATWITRAGPPWQLAKPKE